MLEEEVGEEEPEDGRTTSGAELRTLLRTPRVGTRYRLVLARHTQACTLIYAWARRHRLAATVG